MMDAIEIADKVRQQNWKTGGHHVMDSDEAAALIQSAVDEAREAGLQRLILENWQLKGALGYPVPGDIPSGNFKCGMCEARALTSAHGRSPK